MRTNGTAWAWRPVNPDREGVPNLLRNLVTGESRPVAKATTENMWCTPSFCFGDLPKRTIYVQHLDGTGRLTVAMPSSGTMPFPFLYPNAAGGLFTYGNVIVDPLTGRAGVLPNPGSANCFRNDTVSGQPYFGWGSPDQGCDHRTGFAILPYGY
jgi:hypothetical protein